MPNGRKRKGDSPAVAQSASQAVQDEPFSKKSWTEDLTLVVEEKKLFICKAVLALASPVFARMFESDFLEKNKEEIELKGKKYLEVVEFLLSIYPSTRKQVTVDNVFLILPLADEYQIDSLRKDCEQCLLQEISLKQSHKCTMSVFRYLQQASLYSLERLEDRCLEELREKPQKEIEAAEDAYPLPVECKNKLLGRINKQLEENLRVANEKIEQLKKEKRSLKSDLDLYKSNYFERELKRREDFFDKEEDLAVQGIIKLEIDNVSAMEGMKFSKPRKLRDVEWTLKAEKYTEDGKTFLSTWVSFEPDRPHMMCFADGTFTLISTNKKNLDWFLKDVTFSSVSFTWGCQKLIEWKDFIDPENGYVVNDKANLQVFMMVHDPHEA